MRFIRLQERHFATARRRLIVVLTALALGGVLPGPTWAQQTQADPTTAKARLARAEQLRRAGNLPAARKELELALKAAPAIEHLLLRDNRLQEAQRAFEEAVRLQPEFAPPHYQLGKLLVRSDQPAPAARELEAAIRDDPALAQAYYQLSRAYTLLGENDKAAQALATFNQIKKQETDDDQEFLEGLRKEVEGP